jgi:aminoglycoside 6'-N-acetyltransferase I
MASMDSNVRFRRAQPADRDQLSRLREALWPDASAEEHARELTPLLTEGASMPTPTILLVAESDESLDEAGEGKIVGFLEADLHSHADGCDTSRPVGFIEGWYVAEAYRRQGIARKLLASAEEWARAQGCIEMASDTWIDNELSQRVHQALGYEVVDRCVHYRRKL